MRERNKMEEAWKEEKSNRKALVEGGKRSQEKVKRREDR